MFVNRNRYNRERKSFGTQLMKSFSLVLSLTFALLVGMNVINTLDSSEQLVINSKRSEMSLMNNLLESFRQNISAIQSLISDSYTNDVLRKNEKLTTTEITLLEARLNNIETNCVYTVRDMNIPFYVVRYSESGLRHISRNYKGCKSAESIGGSEWLCDIREQKLTEGNTYNSEEYNKGIDDELFYINYENIYKIEDGKKKFVLTTAVCVKSEWINELYKGSVDNDTGIYIFDNNGNLFSSNKIGINENVEQSILEFFEDDSDILKRNDSIMIKWHSADSGFTIIENVSRNAIYSLFVKNFISSIFVAVIVFGIAALLLYRLSKSLLIPFGDFCNRMEKIDYSKEMNSPKEIKFKEIYQLYKSYSVLNKRNCALIEKQLDNEKKIKEEEMKFLRAQINPHFLYNTLFSIKCTAKLGKVDDACRMIDLLEDMLRKNLHTTSETQPICDEIVAIKDYISLVGYGLDQKLNFKYNVEEHLQHKHVMKFLIQPMVENAVFHGIKPIDRDGLICIDIKEENEKIVVSIKDNGIGISDEQLKRLNDESETEQKYQGHIGLENVKSRIKRNYGNSYGMSIKSEMNEGTMVTLILPIIDRGE